MTIQELKPAHYYFCTLKLEMGYLRREGEMGIDFIKGENIFSRHPAREEIILRFLLWILPLSKKSLKWDCYDILYSHIRIPIEEKEYLGDSSSAEYIIFSE